MRHKRRRSACLAGNLGLGAVGVYEASGDVGVFGARHPLNAIGAHTVVAVANGARERRDICGANARSISRKSLPHAEALVKADFLFH